MKRPVILIFVRYFLPGFRAGGPIRSVANIVRALSSEYDFRIVCLDRDHGVSERYSNIITNEWQDVDGISVFYASPDKLGFSLARKLFKEIKPDMIYLNSLFDRAFSMIPFFALGRGRKIPILLTPRGELSFGALGLKSGRKSLFLNLVKKLSLYDHVFWHASSKTEAERILNVFAPASNKIFLASNLAEMTVEKNSTGSTLKQSGRLRIVLPARISKMKNTLAAIRIVSQLKGDVEFDLWGPCEDKEYWAACQSEISRCPINVKVKYQGELEHDKLHLMLQQYDVMLMPTLGENFGHSIIEALSAGLPVVISDRTPWRNLVVAGVGADLPLANEGAFIEQLNFYLDVGEMQQVQIRGTCLNYAKKWKQKVANLDDYRGMFNTVIG